MGEAAVDHVRPAHAAADGAHARLHLRDHAAGQGGQHRLEVVDADAVDQRRTVRPVRVKAFDVGEHDELFGAQRGRQRSRGGVGVDVVHHTVNVRGDGGDHRDAPGVDDVQHRVRVDLGDLADEPDVDLLTVHSGLFALGGEQPGVFAGDADRVRPVCVDQPDELAADLAGEHHPDDVHRLRGGDAQAALELALDAEA